MGGPQWIVHPDNDIHHSHMVRVMVILGHTAMIPTNIILENDNPLNLLDIGPDLLNISLNLLDVSLDLLPVILNLHTGNISIMWTIIMNLDLVGQGISLIIKIQMKDSKIVPSMIVTAPHLILSPRMIPTL